MITAIITSTDGELTLEVGGHAELSPGNDPLCGAVSVIVQTLEECLGSYAEGTLLASTVGKGYARLIAAEGGASALFMGFAVTAFRLLEEAFPENLRLITEDMTEPAQG